MVDSTRTEKHYAAVAAWYRALGDPHRLAILDHLDLTDATPGQLSDATGLTSNLLAFHLDTLEEVGIIARHRSRGDGRRRYVTLGPDAPASPTPTRTGTPAERVLFVCTRNSARSQLAAAMWTTRTSRAAWSAGSQPGVEVHPLAVQVAARHGLDLGTARPSGYADVDVEPDLVVSVCDRAREAQPPFRAPLLHWSIPEPRAPDDFPATWDELDRRIDRLARRAVA